MKVAVTLSSRDYDAVLFDLDGVLTRTARVHAAAWKKLFDGFLEQRATKAGTPFVPFDIETDYPRYVDGKPRYDGVADFLESRGIELPLEAPEDGPDVQSVRALGNLKDRYFLEQLEQHGAEPYEPAIALVRALRAQEIKTVVVSSSNNCALVLEAAGIADLFDARVDGTDITRLELDGKPAPDAFLEAARRIGAVPSRAVVVEDAIAGVAAGRAGRFGCVIGVDRRGQAQALRDVVVTDLAEVQVAVEPSSAWSLVFEDFDVAKEGIREALCTLGNGYFATRGAAAGAVADGIHYPGTYLAGGRMFVPFHDGVISQFEGYDMLREFDWEGYRARYGNIQRLDLILEAENDSANRYKLAKQADVLMLFYLFSSEELRELFDRLGYPFEYETIPRNIAYYTGRASHGSTLCRVVYSWVLARSDRPRAMDFFAQALRSDVSDIQQGTTAEGVHLGAMAGTVDLVQRVSTGLEVRGDVLHLAPELPREMERLDMRIRYRGHSLDLRLTRGSLTIRGRDGAAPAITLCVDGEICEFASGTTRVFRLNDDATDRGAHGDVPGDAP